MPLDQILKANREALDALPEEQDIASNVEISPNSRVTGAVRIGANTNIINCIVRGPVQIGKNCHLQDAYIGPYTTLGDNIKLIATEIENSVVEALVCIGDLESRIQDSHIGKATQIKRQTSPGAFLHFDVAENSHIELI